MIQPLAKTENDRICSDALIETDRRYFETAAEVDALSCGYLAWMPGLTRLAASCVIHRVTNFTGSPDAWLDEIERAVAARNAPLVRVYLDECPEDWKQSMLARGYQQRAEIGFLSPVGDCAAEQMVELTEVRTDADWEIKRALHEESMHGPDGYNNQADLWVEMEQRKCATGLMHTFLVRRGEDVCGTVGAIAHGPLLRLKNILIGPRFRRIGLGVATVQQLWRMAGGQPGRRLGVYAVEGGPGSKLYQRAGLNPINCQYEWSRRLEESNE